MIREHLANWPPRHDFISARSLASGGFNPRGDLLTEFIMTTGIVARPRARTRLLGAHTLWRADYAFSAPFYSFNPTV